MLLVVPRSRARLIYSTLSFACIFAFIYYSTASGRRGSILDWDRWSSSCPSVPPSTPYVSLSSSNTNHTRWRELTLKNTPGSLMHLPSTRAKSLRRVQHHFPHGNDITEKQRSRRDTVKAVFLRCWQSYKENAWLEDELTPVSGNFNTRYGGWGATLVDSLDTLWIMGLNDEFYEAISAAVLIDFSNPEELFTETISVFETTIRFLGGLLSAYDLTDCKDKRLLDKAAELGNVLYAAFDTPTRMPVNSWSPHKAFRGEVQTATADDNILANLGSLSMEFTHLSQLTGDMRYFDAVQRVTDTLEVQQEQTRLPGMWPQRYNVATTDFTQGYSFTLGAEADSTYEYLIKMHVLLSGNDAAGQYERMYNFAMDTAMQNMFFQPMTPNNEDVLISGRVTVFNETVAFWPESEHLTCFVGGMLALSGRILNNDTHFEAGAKLTNGCAWGYRASPTGILPENYQTSPCPIPDCKWNQTAWEAAGGILPGFTTVRDARYHLRPEAIESVFILHRTTGDTKYQDMAWEMFESINNHTNAEFGNAALESVLIVPPPKSDFMESFWLGETLKYFYLIFSEPGLVSLDDFVLNTEAHPFRIPR